MNQTKTLSKRKLRELGYLEWPTLELRRWVAQCKAAGGEKYNQCKEYLRLQHNQAQADHEYERRSNVATIPDTEPVDDQNIATWEYLDGLGLRPNTIEHTVAKLLIGGYLQVDIADKLNVSHQYITQIVNKLRDKLADKLPKGQTTTEENQTAASEIRTTAEIVNG